MNLQAEFVGALLGSAVGDAIGELAFRYPRRESLEAHVETADGLRYTDDTAMAMALAESLNSMEDVLPARLGDTFKRHFWNEPWRGYGPGPPEIFSRVDRGACTYEEAALQLYAGEGSLGNGAAMRIAPLGLFYSDSPSLYEKARLSAIVTHAHPVGIDGAAVQAKAVGQAVALDPEQTFSPQVFLAGLLAFARSPEMLEKLKRLQAFLEHQVSPAEAAAELGHSVKVHESMPFAAYCFLRHSKRYEDCLWCAIGHGGDRDTMGAMAGAISGAYLGVEAIPAAWRKKLENHGQIEALARGLVARRADRRGP